MTRVALILSGCGVYDGSEIHEAVLTLLYLDKANVAVECYAPDKPQMHVVNHLTGQPEAGESRNVLKESARIARRNSASQCTQSGSGGCSDLSGGYGAAKTSAPSQQMM